MDDKEAEDKTFKVFLIAAAVAISIIILSALTGCAVDPNHESMDECHTYCCWHGKPVRICDE